MNKIVCTGYGGSGNHGCEAIARSVISMFDKPVILLSHRSSDDVYYKMTDICQIEQALKFYKRFSGKHLISKLFKIIFSNDDISYRFIFKKAIKFIINKNLILSIGGDNYCYNDNGWVNYLQKVSLKKHCTNILLGCSIEPKVLEDKELLEKINKYSKIIARESITYMALINAGINNVSLYPDPAFILKSVSTDLPKGFIEANTIGINLSPLVLNYEEMEGIIFQNYVELIQYIIDKTDMQIALIPHVVWTNNDDRIPLHALYEKFSYSGRLVEIPDHNCMELKYIISRCRMFIGTRTHATIAAYSTCVPTLVVGYSVKSKGIAKDIFGTYENYVLSAQLLQNKDDLVKSFQWFYNHENEISIQLKKIIPSYTKKAGEIIDEIRKVVGESC